jgi:nucleoside-diphosphate-sugar epimerase
MKCAITGASGFVGSAIAQAFRDRGWEVLSLSRRSAPAATEHFSWSLNTDPNTIPWKGIDALIHCAHDFNLTKWEDIHRVNVEGGLRLLHAAKEHGVTRGVFISSVSCFEGCKSLYGKAKLELEAEALKLGFAALRPGLVYSEKPGGIMGSLFKVAGLSPILPLIGDGSYPQYLVHSDDLASLIFELCATENDIPSRPLSAANPERIPFRELLRRIAARQGKKVGFLPIPWPLILGGIKTLEALHLPSPFRSDSLVGIVFQNPSPDFTIPPGYKTTFRRFD